MSEVNILKPLDFAFSFEEVEVSDDEGSDGELIGAERGGSYPAAQSPHGTSFQSPPESPQQPPFPQQPLFPQQPPFQLPTIQDPTDNEGPSHPFSPYTPGSPPQGFTQDRGAVGGAIAGSLLGGIGSKLTGHSGGEGAVLGAVVGGIAGHIEKKEKKRKPGALDQLQDNPPSQSVSQLADGTLSTRPEPLSELVWTDPIAIGISSILAAALRLATALTSWIGFFLHCIFAGFVVKSPLEDPQPTAISPSAESEITSTHAVPEMLAVTLVPQSSRIPEPVAGDTLINDKHETGPFQLDHPATKEQANHPSAIQSTSMSISSPGYGKLATPDEPVIDALSESFRVTLSGVSVEFGRIPASGPAALIVLCAEFHPRVGRFCSAEIEMWVNENARIRFLDPRDSTSDESTREVERGIKAGISGGYPPYGGVLIQTSLNERMTIKDRLYIQGSGVGSRRALWTLRENRSKKGGLPPSLRLVLVVEMKDEAEVIIKTTMNVDILRKGIKGIIKGKARNVQAGEWRCGKATGVRPVELKVPASAFIPDEDEGHGSHIATKEKK
jgi:hypothetical protein